MTPTYLTKHFARLARRSGLPDDSLSEAVDRVEDGKIDADLGGGLIKQRVARPNEGRAGGLRAVLAYRRGMRAIFLHLFPKARQANLSAVELEVYRDLAEAYDALTDEQFDALVATRGWKRIEKKE